jgi:AcrR family transcriptional regulator
MAENDKLTEEKIYEAAKAVFAERGMDGARMQEIADRAGINKSLLHYYYRSKEKLFSAIFDELALMTFRKFAQLFETDLPFEDQISNFFSEHIEFLKANPGLPIFILTEINRSPERMRNLIEKISYGELWHKMWDDIASETNRAGARMQIDTGDITQLVTTAISITVFPFAARNLITLILEKDGCTFETYIEERKEFATRLVTGFLKSKNLKDYE